jgi:exodeoxyribonuclease VII small subunit
MASFEEQLTALEGVVERLERGELTLDESVRLFEEGVKLSEACKKELEAAEGRIQVLVERGGGKMKVQELEVETEVDTDDLNVDDKE